MTGFYIYIYLVSILHVSLSLSTAINTLLLPRAISCHCVYYDIHVPLCLPIATGVIVSITTLCHCIYKTLCHCVYSDIVSLCLQRHCIIVSTATLWNCVYSDFVSLCSQRHYVIVFTTTLCHCVYNDIVSLCLLRHQCAIVATYHNIVSLCLPSIASDMVTLVNTCEPMKYFYVHMYVSLRVQPSCVIML